MSIPPLVTIIINNYNYAQFLGQAIESALNQSYPNTEVIVVDDGSTDGSREVIGNYADSVMSVLKANGGQASAFNAAFPVSRGAIVCFLDSDDLLLPDAAQRVAGLFENQGVVKVHWSLRLIDDIGRETGQVIPKRLQATGDYIEVAIREGPIYDWHSTPPTSGNAWARWFLEKVLPIPEVPFRLGGDEYLLALAPVFGTVRAVLEPLGCYRTHGNNHYFNKALDDNTVALYQMRFAQCSKALQYWLGRMGVETDTAAWNDANFNAIWLRRLKQARMELCSVIPEGHAVILIDECELGGAPFLPGRKVLPFLEKEGLYWGPPANSAQAIGECERLRGLGSTFLALWWTSYWWTSEYDSFWRYLNSRFRLVVDDESVRIFDLRDAKR